MRLGWIILSFGTLALAQTVTLTPTPVSVAFTYQAGSDKLPSALTLAVKASAGTPSYTVAVGGRNTEWLTVTPETGRIPASLSVRANPSGMIAGKYQATISVSVTGVSSSPAVVPVTLTVTDPPPALVASTTTLNFAWPPQAVPPQTLKLTTTGGPISYVAVVSGATWLTVSPASGIALPGSPAQLRVSVDATGLAPQDKSYAGKITITTSGTTSTKTLSVNANLAVSPLKPNVSSLWPAAVKTGSPAATVTVRGANFFAATVFKAEGLATPLKTTVISSTVAWAVIPETSLASDGALRIYASNPAPGGDSLTSTLTVTSGAVVQAVVNAASGVAGVASPGMVVSLYGDGIGPPESASMIDADSDGYADSKLAGVTVTVNGIGAPILLVTQDRIDVQVPYEVLESDSVPVQVVNGAATANGTVRITATAPGIFTSDGSGIGQAAAFNHNPTTGAYALNSQAAPAKPGDTVVLYLTGEGDYAFSVSPRTGYLVTTSTLLPIPQLSPIPDVTIGGKLGTVTFAGPIPGSLLGLLRIDTVVPEGSTLGNAVPVSIKIGIANSQAGVTIAIKK